MLSQASRAIQGMHYGFTITARKLSEESGGAFLSGQALERGAFRLILPLKPRFKMAEGEESDYVPAWGTKEEVCEIIQKLEASMAAETHKFKLCDIRATVEAGGVGSSRVKYFRGVAGWVVPEFRHPRN